MEFSELIAKRKSTRSFRNERIPKSSIDKILEAVNSAPSAGNLQAYEAVLVTEKQALNLLAKPSHEQDFIAEADIAVVFFANPKKSSARYGKRGEKLYAIQDAAIAATFAILKAVDLGLSSVWVGAFDDSEVSKILNSPDYLIPTAIIPIGYANESPKPRSRRSLNDLVKHDSF